MVGCLSRVRSGRSIGRRRALARDLIEHAEAMCLPAGRGRPLPVESRPRPQRVARPATAI